MHGLCVFDNQISTMFVVYRFSKARLELLGYIEIVENGYRAVIELNDILLSDRAGRLMDIDDIDTLVGNVAKKAMVKFTLYMLRHQFSTDLHNAGTNPAVIRDLMGHESATMSLDYAVSDEKDRIKAINQRSAEKHE